MNKGHIFISYSRQDVFFAKSLNDKLRKKFGFEVWLDRTNIEIGTDWKEAIEVAIQSSFAVVLLISKDSMNSQYVAFEWAYAMGHQVPIIPVLCRPHSDGYTIPPPIAAIQICDFSDPDYYPWGVLAEVLNKAQTNYEARAQQEFSYIKIDNVLRDLTSSDSTVQSSALQVVVQNNIVEAENIVARLFRDSRLDDDFRINCFYCLIGLNPVTSAKYVVECIQHENEAIRFRGHKFASDVALPLWIRDLMNLAKNTKTVQLVNGLPVGRMNSIRLLPHCVKALYPQESVIETRNDIGHLLTSLLDDENPHIIGAAILAITAIAWKPAIEKIETFAEDERKSFVGRDKSGNAYRLLSDMSNNAISRLDRFYFDFDKVDIEEIPF